MSSDYAVVACVIWFCCFAFVGMLRLLVLTCGLCLYGCHLLLTWFLVVCRLVSVRC